MENDKVENLELQNLENDSMKYGEKILKEFDIQKDLEIWPNKNKRNYTIKLVLPEFACLCPRSGYPDFATVYVDYIPDEFVVELKAIKLYINSFMGRNISHEDSINEIYEVLETKLKPKYLKVVGDFNPRGNVHTVIEIDSNLVTKEQNSQDDIINAIKDEFKSQKESDKKEREERKKAFGDRADRKDSGFKRDDKRGFGDRKSFGDKRSFGEKRSFSDRKDFGDKRNFGDKKESKFGNKRDDKRGERRSFDDKKPKKEPFFKVDFSDKKPQVVKKDDNV